MSDRIVALREGESSRAGLEAWFRSRGHEDARVEIQPSPAATGYSHETIIFDVTHGEQTQRLVARVEPMGEHNVFPDPDLSIEYRLLDAISSSDVPLPKLHGYEDEESFLGAEFYVMEHLDGLVPPDSPPYCMGGWLYDATPEQRAQVWWSGLGAMARVHKLDSGPLEFVNIGRPAGMAGEMQYWDNYITEFCSEGIPESVARAWDWLQANVPTDGATALCWGDSRLGNQMFARFECIALLDWEMACISDPIQDLAWFEYFDDVFSSGLGVPRLQGMPTRDETVARYEELTGTTVKNLDYFEIFSGVRFAVIMQRLSNLQAQMGRPVALTFENFVTMHLKKMCDEKGIP